MWRLLSVLFVILGLTGVSVGISAKVDFGEEESSVAKTSSKEDEDVEVKHTIVVSTKLKNNNRKGLHTSDDKADITYSIGNRKQTQDSDEIPIIKGYRAVETTQIRTPDSRLKPTTFVYPEIVLPNRNSRDEFDLYPNFATNPMQWKPSSFFNNINQWNQEDNFFRRNRPDYQKFNRRVSDDGVREFYCRKCRELSGPRGCGEQKSHSWLYETTTQKIKIDGKIAKLN